MPFGGAPLDLLKPAAASVQFPVSAHGGRSHSPIRRTTYSATGSIAVRAVSPQRHRASAATEAPLTQLGSRWLWDSQPTISPRLSGGGCSGNGRVSPTRRAPSPEMRRTMPPLGGLTSVGLADGGPGAAATRSGSPVRGAPPPRVSLATWAGLESSASGLDGFPPTGFPDAVVAGRPLDTGQPLVAHRITSLQSYPRVGSEAEDPQTGRFPFAATWAGPRRPSLGPSDRGLQPAQHYADSPTSATRLAAPSTLAGHRLQEVRAISPAPCRPRVSTGPSLALSALPGGSGGCAARDRSPPAPAARPQLLTRTLPGGALTPPAPQPRELVAPPRPLQPAAPQTIALDVDEVLVRYVDGFRKFLQRERPHGPLDTDSVFHEAHDPHSPWRLQFAMSGGLDNLEAVPGALAALRRLKAAGLRLEVVTSRPPIMRESTEALLGKLFPSDTFSAAHFVGPGEKGRTCNAIRALALVDDQIPNIVDANSCGVIAVLFNFSGSYPWAVCNPEDLPAGVMRLETWAATSEYLLSALRISGPHTDGGDLCVVSQQHPQEPRSPQTLQQQDTAAVAAAAGPTLPSRAWNTGAGQPGQATPGQPLASLGGGASQPAAFASPYHAPAATAFEGTAAATVAAPAPMEAATSWEQRFLEDQSPAPWYRGESYEAQRYQSDCYDAQRFHGDSFDTQRYQNDGYDAHRFQGNGYDAQTHMAWEMNDQQAGGSHAHFRSRNTWADAFHMQNSEPPQDPLPLSGTPAVRPGGPMFGISLSGASSRPESEDGGASCVTA